MVFVESRSSDESELPSRKSWLEEISSISLSLSSSGSNDSMQLIDKEDHLSIRFFYLFNNRFETLFKVSSVFCSSKERPHIQRDKSLAYKIFRDLLVCYLESNSLYNSCFPNPWFSNEYRIVFTSTREDLQRSTYFFFTSYDRIYFSSFCLLYEIDSIFPESIHLIFRIIICYFFSCSHRIYDFFYFWRSYRKR